MTPLQRALGVAAAFAFSACASPTERPVADPIEGIPLAQQRQISRRDFERTWPLSVSGGTLACAADAVFFRAAGVTYALNDPARTRGSRIEPIRLTDHPPPSNPLGTITQDVRVRIFADARRCDDAPATAAACRQRLQQVHRLTAADLQQIEAEGEERRWPPLAPRYRSLEPLVAAGLQLCPR